MSAVGGLSQWRNLWKADGEIGQQVRKFKAAAKVGSALFVHAGLNIGFLEDDKTLEDVNNDMSTALLENGYPQDSGLQNLIVDNGPLWTRFFSQDRPVVCRAVSEVLKRVGAVRMVVGTPFS